MKKAFFAAATAIAAVATFNAVAADQGDYLTQQLEETDGYYPQSAIVAKPAGKAAVNTESSRAAAENEWLIQERSADSNGSRPVPFVAPTPDETPEQAIAAQDAAAPAFAPAH